MSSELVSQMMKGHRLSLARLISKIEDRDPKVGDYMAEIYPNTGKADVIGITGPPGAGKSTLADEVARELRKQKKRVAIVAVDPSSPFSGGAILGDRIRMQRHAGDEGVFVRSLGTRGKHGGLSHACKEVVICLDAAGFDTIIVESAGVGQTELDILKLAHSVVVVLVPESGDSIQVMKAGLMEIADVFVVNKCDRPGADKIVRELTTMVSMPSHDLGKKVEWEIPVLKTEATKNIGTQDVLEAVAKHLSFLNMTGKIDEKNAEFIRNELLDILTEAYQDEVAARLDGKEGQKILDKLLKKETDPYSVANEMFKKV